MNTTELEKPKTGSNKIDPFELKNNESTCKYNNVLLIDDIDLDNFINEKLLALANFSNNVFSTNGAGNALEFLNNLTVQKDTFHEKYPEVIFVDINMPVMDGFQFMETFIKTFENQPQKPKLVALTSSMFLEDKQKMRAISEEIIFLNKPLTKEMLDNI